jgi:hypothetical protein
MSEPIRDVHAERVRDFYRKQGADSERERIIKLLEEIELDYPPIVYYISEIKGQSQKDNESVVILTEGGTNA